MSASDVEEHVHNQGETTKRRSCTRQSSNIPGEKMVCKKDSNKIIESSESGNIECGHCSKEGSHSMYVDDSGCDRSSFELDGCIFLNGSQGESQDHISAVGDVIQDLSPDSEHPVFGSSPETRNGSDWNFTSCSVSSWGHFSKSRKDHYKYRRSDYSSDSDEDANYVRKKELPCCSSKRDSNASQKSHLPICELAKQPPLYISKNKDSNSKFSSYRNQDGVKPNVFKEKSSVSKNNSKHIGS